MRPSDNPSRSFWLRDCKRTEVKRSALFHGEQVDVLVIGAGMSGVSVAYWLLKMASKRVLLVDSRGIAECASGRNGGHMWPATRPPSEESIQRWGADQMWRVFDFDYECMSLVETFLQQSKVDCGYKTTGAVLLARFKEEVELFHHVYCRVKEMRPQLALELWDAHRCQMETHSTVYIAGLYQPAAGQFIPPAFVRGVLAEAQKLGSLDINSDVTVEAVTRETSGLYVARTNVGDIRASCVVYATNAYTSQLLPQLTAAITPVRGQVVVTEPLNIRWKMSMSMNDGFEYMIQTPDARAVLGGMRWRTRGKGVGDYDDTVLDSDISAALREMLSESFEPLKKAPPRIDYEWTGIMGFSADGQPLIGPLHRERLLPFTGEYVIAGFTGHGMTRCFLAGKAIAEMMCGRLDPEKWIAPFSPSRFLEPQAPLPIKSPFSSTSAIPKTSSLL